MDNKNKYLNDLKNIPTSIILKMFPDISRDMLYFIEDKRVLLPKKKRKAKGKNNKRFYGEEDIKKIFIASLAYGAGLRPEHVLDAIGNPNLIQDEKELSMGGIFIDVLEELFFGDQQQVWNVLVRAACRQLECETCLLYRRSSINDPAMTLLAVGKSKRSIAVDLAASSIHTPPPEWEEWVNAKGTPVNLFGEALQRDPYVKSGVPEYMAAKHFSLLAVPIRSRKNTGELRGWLVLENRFDKYRPSGEGCYFDPAVEAAAKVIAKAASLLFDAALHLQMPGLVMNAIRNQQSLDGFLHGVLDVAVQITGAYRGDISWWDRSSDGAMVIAKIGDSMQPGVLMAKRSVSRRVLETGQIRLIPNVSQDPDYFECDPKTRSELCVPVIPSRLQKPVSVINVESDKLNGFDKIDCRKLQELAEYPAIYSHIFESSETVSRLVSQDGALSGGRLLHILKNIEETEGFDKGIIYLVDYRKGEMRCAALNGFENPDGYDSACSFADSSLATKVFHERKPHFVPNAKDDLALRKNDVELFGMQGPLFGVPLLFGSMVIGVMVAWSSKEGKVTIEKEPALMRHATFSITTQADAEAEERRKRELQQHSTVLDAIREVLIHMATQSREQALHSILKALIKTDFQRARVFEYDKPGNLFRCLDSVGRNANEPSYKGLEIEIRASSYAQMTVNADPVKGAMVRDPRKILQIDPYAEKLGKPALLPWAVATLFVGGVLYGYIACDNGPEDSPITQTNLDSLNVFGALAAQAVASRHSPNGME